MRQNINMFPKINTRELISRRVLGTFPIVRVLLHMLA